MNDWLGNELNVGDLALYSSTSSNTGMNLGNLTYVGAEKIQLRLLTITSRSNGRSVMGQDLGRLITLQRGTSAFKSVTRYLGKIPNKESNE